MLTLEKSTTLEQTGGLYKFTLAEFDKMNELGFFDNVRVELLDGEIFVMPKQDYRHAQSVRQFTEQLILRLSSQVYISPQLPVILLSLPPDYVEPDIALLKLPKEQYATRDVTSDDVLLAIKVSNSTLEHDQGKKLAAYARNRIPQVWIHNLITGKLEVYRDPDGEEYRLKHVLSEGQQVDVQGFGVSINWW
jgi:Uma2 family endonuclease